MHAIKDEPYTVSMLKIIIISLININLFIVIEIILSFDCNCMELQGYSMDIDL